MKLSELRKKCQRKSDYLITILVTNELSLLLTRLVMNTRMTPNAFTLCSIASGIVCSILYAMGQFQIGSLFLFLSHLFDCTDGNLARAKNEFSLIGKWLDMIGDRLSHSFVFVGVSIYFIKINAYPWAFTSLLDAIFLLNYYYAVDIGISQELHKIKGNDRITKLFTLKGVPIKIGLYEPVIYGFIFLASLGWVKLQIVFVLIASVIGIVFQLKSKIWVSTQNIPDREK